MADLFIHLFFFFGGGGMFLCKVCVLRTYHTLRRCTCCILMYICAKFHVPTRRVKFNSIVVHIYTLTYFQWFVHVCSSAFVANRHDLWPHNEILLCNNYIFVFLGGLWSSWSRQISPLLSGCPLWIHPPSWPDALYSTKALALRQSIRH